MKPRGWVYAITNPLLDGLVKIGFSMKDPILRASEGFDPAGLPDNFVVRYMAFVEEPRLVEQLCHKIIEEHRYKKEWFRISLNHAVATIVAAVERHGVSIVFESERPVDAEQISKAKPEHRAVQSAQRPTPRIRFVHDYLGWDKKRKAWMLKATGRLLGDCWVLQVTEYIDDSQPKREFVLQSVDELKVYCRQQGLELESFPLGVMNPALGKLRGS